MPKLGDVDPTGTYCPVPEDWLKNKFGRHFLKHFFMHDLDLTFGSVTLYY